MNKLIRAVCAFLACAVAAFSLVACSTSGAPVYDTTSPDYVQNIAEDIKNELDSFLSENQDRTTFNAGEENAAKYLVARLTEFGYVDVTTQDFTADENNVKGLNSRNVVARLKGKKGDEANPLVVLGAYYDNRYSQAYNNAVAFKSEAALCGGSGVASLLAVAKYLIENHGEDNALDFDIAIAFFGASYIYTTGATEFLRSGLTVEERKNTVLMVEMQRLGVDYVYAYSDAREIAREAFFDGIAEQNGLGVYKPTQKSPIIINATATDGIPYFQWAHSGVFTVFANAKIPTLNIMGANWESMNISDAESATYPNISYTENDTLEMLAKYYPDYADKMATAATLVIRSLEDGDFIDTMKYDKANFPETEILTMNWIWNLIVLGVLAIVFAVVFFVCGTLGKKYKPVARAPRRMKMAVFGMDYEDKNAADIFIDIKKTGEDIFPGVPNNDDMQHGQPVPPPVQNQNSSADKSNNDENNLNKTPDDKSDSDDNGEGK